MTISSSEKLRIGLLLDSSLVPIWAYSTLTEIRESTCAEIALVLYNGNSTSASKQKPPGRTHRLYRWLDRQLFPFRPTPFPLADASPLLAGIPSATIGLQEDPFLPDASIHQHSLDLILQFGSYAPSDALLKFSRCGVWTPASFKDETAGFREVLAGHPTTTASICHRSHDPNRPPLLYRSHLATDPASPHRNRARLCWRQAAAISRLLQRLHTLRSDRFFAEAQKRFGNSAAISDTTANFHSATNFPRFTGRRLRSGLRALFSFNQWILMRGTGDPLSLPTSEFKPLPPTDDRTWADPFLLRRNDRYFIFIEEKPRGKKGHISLIEMDDSFRCKPPVKIIDQPYHLSYPFPFLWNGVYYLIPESNDNRTIDVYRCTDFPLQWSHHKTLMTDVRASDTTLLQYDSRWWLFTSIAAHPGSTVRDELFLFYADNPLSDSWIPHPQNPIVSDARRARSAGRIFASDGALYRPSQDCAVRYGYCVRINKIIHLTTTEYTEEEIRTIEPTWSRDLIALHTLSHAPGLTLIDVKRRRWRWK
ncbi:MAG: hypothetical protein HOC74_00695 [Gemmatimonadetes bacterium]|jgi:hypothetical protein|nr:hypothetical protein [Gemmatimonadota bacterium]